MPNHSVFGATLRQRRHVVGFTQEELAERARVSVRTVSDIERGVSTAVRRDTVHRLANALALDSASRESFVAVARGGQLLPEPEAPPLAGAVRTPVTPLLGREAEVVCCTALLRRSDVRLVTLSGAGGVGKTRIALEVASRAREQFTAGAVFVRLENVQRPEAVASEIASALGATGPPAPPSAAVEPLYHALWSRHLLMVLDNFEHLTPAADLVAELLELCPGLRVLLTSRRPLRFAGEQVVPVGPLPVPEGPATASRTQLETHPSVRLFYERARAQRPVWAATQGNMRAIAQLCADLDGLPLAIELAAARSAALPPQELLNSMDSPLHLSHHDVGGIPGRHRSMRSCLQWSHTLLESDAQQVFRRLAEVPDGCHLSTAPLVCDLEDRGPRWVFDAITTLTDQNLLRCFVAAGKARLGMLRTTREFALELLSLSGELDSVQRRLTTVDEPAESRQE